jgi:hypothetical protein
VGYEKLKGPNEAYVMDDLILVFTFWQENPRYQKYYVQKSLVHVFLER